MSCLSGGILVQASCLTDHFQCVGVDLEGQGDTPAELDSPVNMLERHVDDLLAIVDHFDQGDLSPAHACNPAQHIRVI